MKKIRIVILLFIIIITSACQSQNVKIADHIAPKIIEAHQSNDISTKELTKQEKVILENFLESEKRENKIININENITFSAQSYSEYETPLLYKIDDTYFLNYNDITWVPVDNDYKFIVNLDGMSDALLKSQVPILYEETRGIDRYNYHLIGKTYDKENKTIDYYYKSIADNSGLIIKFHLTKRKITNISTVYKDLFYYPNEKKLNSNAQIVLQIIGVILLVAAIGFVSIKIMQRFSLKSY